MVSTTKAYVSLLVSSLVILFRMLFYRELSDLTMISPILIIYCLADMKNSRDMQLHHLATVFLNITFYYVIANQQTLTRIEGEKVGNIVKAFFDVEVSTIALAKIHLGYKTIYNKLSFLALFIYFRIFRLTSILLDNYQEGFYLNKVCQDSGFCYLSWYLGSIPIVILNYYWLSLILGKFYTINKKLKN